MSIEIRNLSKRFGSTVVIPDFSLRIAPGEFIALLGPSGCGKSTLLRMLAGLEPVSGGRMLIGERDVTQLPPGQRGIAMVFQQYALYPHMTVRDNLSFGLRNAGMKDGAIAQRVDVAARMLDLGELLERLPAQLSGGQRQRVALGRALVKEPSAFLLDEPMSNLDAALRNRTRVEIARLHKQLRTTMVLVTHDQVEAMTLADRVVVMNQGRIEQVASPIEAYERPATRFVAGFVGNPGMNFIEAQRAGTAAEGSALVTLPAGVTLDTGIALPEAGPAQGWTLGVRPEALLRDPQGALTGQVEVIERLGDRTLLHVLLADGSLVVADGRGEAEPAIGSTVRLAPQRGKLHLFDADGRAHRQPLPLTQAA